MISTSSYSTFSSYTLWKLHVDELWLSRQKAKALAQKGNLLLSCRWLPKMRVYIIIIIIIIIIITRENRKKEANNNNNNNKQYIRHMVEPEHKKRRKGKYATTTEK